MRIEDMTNEEKRGMIEILKNCDSRILELGTDEARQLIEVGVKTEIAEEEMERALATFMRTFFESRELPIASAYSHVAIIIDADRHLRGVGGIYKEKECWTNRLL